MPSVWGPGWYREGSQVWLSRALITVENASGGNGSLDIQIPIPTRDDAFWEAIDSSGDELRVCGPDGVTLLDYALASFNKTNRTGTIQIEGTPVSNSYEAQCVVVYWDSDGASAGSTSVTISSPLDGYWDLGQVPRTRFGPQDFGRNATQPDSGFTKTVDEERMIAFNVGPLLRRARVRTNGQSGLEGVLGLSYEVLNAAGSAQASMVEADSLRLFADTSGLWVMCKVKAGTTDTIYTVSLTVTCLEDSSGGITTTTQVLNPRVYCKVEDVLAA